MAAVPEAAADIAREVMGPVLALDSDARTLLLDMFQCWIDVAGSATATAQALHCHSTTVRYRLRKLEDLTGRSLQTPGDTAELVAALRAVGDLVMWPVELVLTSAGQGGVGRPRCEAASGWPLQVHSE
ncbi:helix-turn-helix domain-containing protein [Streptomyces sp. NPDC052107]|uniref:PucR family transcriptional regulator n=1 Tax=Streptomyces sp. NPDC052107 TaxID=3155632 RepID=UPI00344A947C